MAVQRLKIFLLAAVLFLLAGCSAADDAVIVVDDIAIMFGDDILKYSSQYASTSGDDYLRALAAYGDDLSRLNSQSLDDASRLSANKFLQALSDQAGIPTTTGSQAGNLLFRARPGLTPVQEDVLQYFKTAGMAASDDESALLLESACNIVSYVSLVGEYPQQSFNQMYIRFVAAENNIKLFDIAEFGAEAAEVANDLIAAPAADTPQKAARLIWDGLCLIP